MNVKLLTEKEYLATMSEKMVDASEYAEPAVDVWPYIAALITEGVVQQYVYDNRLVEMVYANDFFDHILLPTHDENIFTVIVVDKEETDIYGYFVLDLNEKYGLDV